MEKSEVWTQDFIIMFVVNFLTAINFYLVMVVVSGYAMSMFGSSPGAAGFSAGMFVIGGLVARLFAGKWIERIDHKRLLTGE